MSTTQPIRDKNMLQSFKNYYLLQSPHPRNYALIVLGLNTALRISDILNLTWEMVYNEKKRKFRTHIQVTEQKTGKESRIFINQEVQKVLQYYWETTENGHCGYLFPGYRTSQNPLSRYQAYRIIRHAAEAIGMEDIIRCHSLRKTFGYHAWKQGTPPALLMNIYNHSSYQITTHYLCIEQDDRDKVFEAVQL